MSGEQLAFPLTLFSGDQAYRGVIRATYWRCITLGLAALLVAASPAGAQTPTVKIAAPFSLTGPNTTGGVPALDAVRLAIEEANASGDGPNIELRTYDDRSDDNAARDAARQIAASDALVVVGPGATTASQAAGPIYAEAGLAAIAPYALGAGGPASPTTFRLTFSTSDMGEALARYLRRVLGGTRAVVIYRDNGFGRPIAMGFRGVAEQIGIAAAYHAFTKPEDAVAFARQATADPEHPAIVLGMLDQDAAPVVAALARQGPKPLILGPTAIAHVAFADNFTKEPEASRDRGFFTDGIYAVSGLIFDSANAEALAFAARYRARYGREPRFEAAQGYDAARLAIAAGRAAIASSGASDMAARRAAVRGYLASLDSPAHAVTGLTGPLWFTPDRGRQQPIRVGRFHGTLFESAPLQLVPVSNPTSVEINAGALMDLGGGRFERRQQVVYTGVFINEISRVDIAQSTFTVDLYLWLRFAKAVGAGAADPTDIDFPDLLRGGFDPKRPAVQGDLDDGTTYRLWRVRGDFKNDYDLHHYPLDRQELVVRLFNARAASDFLVYVQDRRSIGTEMNMLSAMTSAGAPPRSVTAVADPAPPTSPSAQSDDRPGSSVAPAAFRNLTQWQVQRVGQLRDVLATASALGDPRLVGAERVRELSGYRVEVEVRRLTVATLAKTLLPLGIMALIMLASLWFPHGLVKEKITVAITGALSGAVLLASVNSQLGTVGYTMAVEYVFYIFLHFACFALWRCSPPNNYASPAARRSPSIPRG